MSDHKEMLNLSLQLQGFEVTEDFQIWSKGSEYTIVLKPISIYLIKVCYRKHNQKFYRTKKFSGFQPRLIMRFIMELEGYSEKEIEEHVSKLGPGFM